MRFTSIALWIAAGFAGVMGATNTDHAKAFQEFMTVHTKSYESLEDMMHRYSVFATNFDLIEKHNAAGHDWTMGVNEFADLTWEEFKVGALGLKERALSKNGAGVNLAGVINTPDELDWSTKGAVSDIKNQGQCGSCWAFSATGSTEGAAQIKTGRLTRLSEQQLVDCATPQGNQGCNGGLMDYAFDYMLSNGGLCSEEDYPYQGSDGSCKTSCSAAVKISSYQDVAVSDEDALKAAVATGPVSVAIEADQMGFQFYKSGVFTGSCGTNLDHGVLAVGYGSENGQDFWKVKNSWGASWGDHGYIKLKRNGGHSDGQCGIAMAASYPVA